MTRVAIVGAGCAGAAAAFALRDTDIEVTVFEKSRGYGRAATRRRNGVRYDHGANYVKSDDPEVTDLLTEVLDADSLVTIEEPVWTFDADGTIAPGRESDGRKWTYTEGITGLQKRLLDRAAATVVNETRIARLEREGDGWGLVDTDDEHRDTFDEVLLTPPAPQTAELLAATVWDHPLREELHAAVDAVAFRTIYSVVLGYDFGIETPWYGLVNTDREHPVGWLSREELKDGHVPAGETVLVAQMAPDWSVERYDDPSDEVKADAAALVAALLGDDRLADPAWTDRQGWRYALPDGPLTGDAHERAADHGLHLAGDWVAGEGRVHLAVKDGLEAGRRLGE